MRMAPVQALMLLVLPAAAAAQNPFRHFSEAVEARFARSQPAVVYTLGIDAGDYSKLQIEMHVRNAPDTLHLAMARHPEYDDRFWRNVEELRAEAQGAAVPIVREDSARWRIARTGGEVLIRYAIRVPAAEGQRPAWVPFVSPTGALAGGVHSFMYVVGASLAPAHVRLELPADWRIATGLTPTADPQTFFAPTADILMDSPILAGRLRLWSFAVDGVPHRVVYWPSPRSTPFDTTRFTRSLSLLVRQAVDLFGRAPYREYAFLFRDDAYGGLEHYNSVTLGAPSARLAEDPSDLLSEAAHEFLHTWNLMRIRPAEYRSVTWEAQPPSAGLWWSEGLTMFYADVLLRRAGEHLSDSTRLAHLERLIERYLAFPGNGRVPAEVVSRSTYSGSGILGDYVASSHLQGELIGTMLDLVIRDATGGRRSMDDVMRLMLERFSGERGFVGKDVERAVSEVCSCTVTSFFDAHVRGGTPLDFDRFLGLMGMRLRATWVPALTRNGDPAPDLRVRPANAEGPGPLKLVLLDPRSAWGRAGLHGGDELVAVNGAPAGTWAEFRGVLGSAGLGDTLRVEVRRDSAPVHATVILTGYDQPSVRIEQIEGASTRQRTLLNRWMRAVP